MRDNMDEAVRRQLRGRDAVETCLVDDTSYDADAGPGVCHCSEFWLVEAGALLSKLVCD